MARMIEVDMPVAIQLNTDTPGQAIIIVSSQATVADALAFAKRGMEIAGREVKICCYSPPVGAALAWVLKPWLRAGRWAVNDVMIKDERR